MKKKHGVFRTLNLALWVFLATACAKPADFAPVNGVIDLAEAIPGDWDRVCVLNPYTTNSMAKQVIGIPVNVQMRSDIYSSDSITLLVAVDGEQVFEMVEVSRNVADFTPVGGTCFERSQARFNVTESGYRYARPVDTDVRESATQPN